MDANPIRKRILFQCPTAIRAAYPAIDNCHFETVPGGLFGTSGEVLCLKLLVGSGKYTPSEDQEESEYQRSIIDYIAPVPYVVVGFEAVFDYAELDFQHLVLHLGYNCLSPDRRRHTPLQLVDFVKPTWNDKSIYQGEPCTVRRGRIMSVQGSGASVGMGSAVYSDAFTVRFKEKDKRLVLG